MFIVGVEIKKVYIAEDEIADHVGSFPKSEVLNVLKAEVEKSFGIQPIILTESDSEDFSISDGDLVIADRHNVFARILASKPVQLSLLPLENELKNNPDQDKENLTELLRGEFYRSQ